MSYILDALRKADAQRERDASRGIHAQTPSLGTRGEASAPQARMRSVGVIVAGVVIAGAAAWFFMRGDAHAPALQVTGASQSAPSSPTSGAANALPTQTNMAAASAISPPPPAALTPAPVTPPQAAHVRAAEGPTPNMQSSNVSPVAAPPPTAPNAAPGAAASAPMAGGLPPDAPRVAISGGVYSPNPLQRMLIVNGQVFNEGSEVAPGLKIEAIQPRTAILGFRGARYTVAY